MVKDPLPDWKVFKTWNCGTS